MFVSPGDIFFSIGPFSIYYYGIIMALSLLLGILVASNITKKLYPELSSEIIYDIAPYIIMCGIIGARLYYCYLSRDYYLVHPKEIIQIWQGGISIHGAIIGGLIGGILYAKTKKLPILKLCDIFSYGLILGQALGRWGNFFNSEAFGLPTDNFFKLYIPIYKRPLEYLQYNFFHPTFLYESILDIIIFFILLFVIRKMAKNIDGIIFFSYLIMYSFVRILIEQIRIDSILNVFGIPIAQLVSLALIFIGIIGIFIIRLKNENSGQIDS